jgi:hypothetical protein
MMVLQMKVILFVKNTKEKFATYTIYNRKIQVKVWLEIMDLNLQKVNIYGLLIQMIG